VIEWFQRQSLNPTSCQVVLINFSSENRVLGFAKGYPVLLRTSTQPCKVLLELIFQIKKITVLIDLAFTNMTFETMVAHTAI